MVATGGEPTARDIVRTCRFRETSRAAPLEVESIITETLQLASNQSLARSRSGERWRRTCRGCTATGTSSPRSS
jgi:hypothetical protein